MTNYIVYLHKNKINNKVYIGQTSLEPQKRWGKNGIGYKNQFFYKAIQKYGWENFEHIILAKNLNANQATEIENYYIKLYDSLNPNKGYNKKIGQSLSEETKQKMSQNWDLHHSRVDKSNLMIFLNKTIDRSGSNNPMYGANRKSEKAGRKRKVQCIETGDIFETLTDASKWCNSNGSNLRSHIAQQIQGKRKSCGVHPITHEKLHWKYID